MIMHIEDDIRSGGYRIEKSDRVVSEKVQTLVRKYRAYDKNESRPIGHYEHADRVITFKSYRECELEEKQKIREYEQRVTEILTSEDERFDIPGRIRIPVYMGSTFYLDIDVTPRELAEAGIDYKDFNWKSIEHAKEEQKARITPKTISKATSGLHTRAINHIKELFSKRKDNRNNER